MGYAKARGSAFEASCLRIREGCHRLRTRRCVSRCSTKARVEEVGVSIPLARERGRATDTFRRCLVLAAELGDRGASRENRGGEQGEAQDLSGVRHAGACTLRTMACIVDAGDAWATKHLKGPLYILARQPSSAGPLHRALSS